MSMSKLAFKTKGKLIMININKKKQEKVDSHQVLLFQQKDHNNLKSIRH